MNLQRDVLVGGVLLVVAVVYFLGAWPLPSGRGEPGPAFLPQILSGALTLVGLFILIRGLKTSSTPTPDRESSVDHSRWKPWAAALFTVLYVVSFQPLGFALSTWLYTFAVTIVFRRKPAAMMIAVPVVATFLIYLLFQIGLGVQLPGGPVGDLLSNLQASSWEFVVRGL